MHCGTLVHDARNRCAACAFHAFPDGLHRISEHVQELASDRNLGNLVSARTPEQRVRSGLGWNNGNFRLSGVANLQGFVGWLRRCVSLKVELDNMQAPDLCQRAACSSRFCLAALWMHLRCW